MLTCCDRLAGAYSVNMLFDFYQVPPAPLQEKSVEAS